MGPQLLISLFRWSSCLLAPDCHGGYNEVIRSSRLRTLVSVSCAADRARQQSIWTALDGRAVNAIADDFASGDLPGPRYHVLHRCRRGHAEDNGHCFRSTATGQRDMTGIHSCGEPANGRHDLNRSGRRSVAGGNGQPGLVAGSHKSERPCPGVCNGHTSRREAGCSHLRSPAEACRTPTKLPPPLGRRFPSHIPMSRRPPRDCPSGPCCPLPCPSYKPFAARLDG
jgi:hypothetical protein